MLNVINYIVNNIILILYTFYAWKQIDHSPIKIKYSYAFVTSVFVICFNIMSFMFTNIFVRFSITTFILAIANMIVYKNHIKQALLLSMISQLNLFIGEVICLFLVILGINNLYMQSIDKLFGSIFLNILIAIFATLLINIPFIKKKCQHILIKYNKINNFQIIIPITILIISINILLALIYFKVDNLILLTINTILVLLYTFIILNSLKDKNLFMEVKEENKELSTHLKEYEEILSQQQRNNHESKTELAVVRNLLKKDKKAGLKCLDMIIGNKEDLDETFYQRCQKMPSGIQGVVYQKLLLADPNIQIYIEVSPDIPKNDLENKLNGDIFLAGCKIIGVFLGNALEEVNEIENIDNKKLSIQLYLEKNDTLVIQIGNTYRRNTDFSKLEEIGYTTKGKNHGQGLALVQDIENKYFNLKHETIVSGSMIFQKLKIKGLKL